MTKFFSKYKGIIIGAVVIILIFIGYGMLKSDPEPAKNEIEKTLIDPVALQSASNDDPGAAFVLQLLAIQNINFKTEFFLDPVYLELVDQSRELEDRPVGRPNPFAPLGEDDPLALPGAGTGFILTSPSSTPAAGTAGGAGAGAGVAPAGGARATTTTPAAGPAAGTRR